MESQRQAIDKHTRTWKKRQKERQTVAISCLSIKINAINYFHFYINTQKMLKLKENKRRRNICKQIEVKTKKRREKSAHSRCFALTRCARLCHSKIDVHSNVFVWSFEGYAQWLAKICDANAVMSQALKCVIDAKWRGVNQNSTLCYHFTCALLAQQ